MPLDPKKLGALVDRHAEKKKTPPGKNGGPPFGKKGKNPFAKDGKKDDAADGQPDDQGDQGGEHDEGKDAQIAEQQAQRIANGNGDDHLHDLAADVHMDGDEGGEGGADDGGDEPKAPEWATDADIWARAEKAVESLQDVDPNDEAAVLVHTYQALGGTIAEEGDDDAGGGDDGADELPDDAGE